MHSSSSSLLILMKLERTAPLVWSDYLKKNVNRLCHFFLMLRELVTNQQFDRYEETRGCEVSFSIVTLPFTNEM